MGLQVINGAPCTCTFGTAPAPLVILPNCVDGAKQPSATIMDNIPFVNIMPFAMCTSLANPSVAAATAAASGALTPMPCTPVPTAPWAPGVATTTVKNMPALNDSSKLMCSYAGVITISFAGQTTVTN